MPSRLSAHSVSAHSAGAYTATLYMLMVNVMKGVGRAPLPSPAWANFTLMMECTPERSRCNSVYSVVLPPHQRRGGVHGGYTTSLLQVHTRRAQKGWAVNILEGARHWIGLLQYYLSTAKTIFNLQNIEPKQ